MYLVFQWIKSEIYSQWKVKVLTGGVILEQMGWHNFRPGVEEGIVFSTLKGDNQLIYLPKETR